MNTNTTHSASLLHRSFPVLGLSCASCAASVQSMLLSLDGVRAAAVNYANSTAAVEYDQTQIQASAFKKAIQSIGYDLVIESEEKQDQAVEKALYHQYKRLRSRSIWSVMISIPLIIISMWGIHLPFNGIIQWLLATPVLFIFGRSFYRNAYNQAVHYKAGMDLLVSLSTLVAYLYSLSVLLFPGFWASKGLPGHLYFESAAIVITFLLLGKLLELGAKGRSASDIKKLMSKSPFFATVITDGQPKQVSVNTLKIGDQLLVKPGESIPVDGQIRSGQPLIDEKMITGEPLASQKQPGDMVFAGTLNKNTSFELLATKVGSDTVLASIVRMVREAQGNKAPIERLVDKIAGKFVAFVMIIALLTFLSWWWLAGTEQLSRAIIAVVTVLIIACPCALGLATPAAIMVGIGRGAHLGILIKDATQLETLSSVTDIVLDKTGTLTIGSPVITEAIWLENHNQYKTILYSIESNAHHPLAQAVAIYAEELMAQHKNMETQDTSDIPVKVTVIPGRGIEATVGKVQYYVGNNLLMLDNGISINFNQQAAFYASHQNDTIVYFAKADTYELIAVMALCDELKPEAISTIQRLKDQNIHLHMLTGDNGTTAKHIAGIAGISHYQGNLLPEDKLKYIEALQKNGKIVAMVGDGINDSAALVKANISMAMSKGSAIAMDVAGITIVGDYLDKIPDSIMLSRLTNRTIKNNLFWAFFYNLTGIPIAAGILYPFSHIMLNPMIAGAAMALSSLCVLTASLRLRYRTLQ